MIADATSFVTEPRPPDLWTLCRAMTEHAPMPMAMVEGPQHTVCCLNPAFCRLFDKPPDELIGKDICQMLPEGEKCLALLTRIVRTGESETLTELQPSKLQPVFWACTMWPVHVDGQAVGVMIQVTEAAQLQAKTLAMNEALMLGSLRQHELTEAADWSNAQLQAEITERKQTEKALNRAQAQLTDRAGQLQGLIMERTSELTASNEQLETFVYSIAHDLRAPLRAIRVFSTMLEEELGAGLNETGTDYLGRIGKSAHFMDVLVTDLLAFSRVSQQHVELAPLGLEKVIEAVISRVENEMKERSGCIENSGPWPMVLAHEATLTQVLFNLMSNGLKFIAPGVSPRLRLRTEEQGEFIRVWVEDNGVGIAPDHQAQIFRLFTRLHGEEYAGTGVGLAIVQKGVERMGGRVGVESELGQGSRFWFELKKP
jgi:signal transduction histidine kinase